MDFLNGIWTMLQYCFNVIIGIFKVGVQSLTYIVESMSFMQNIVPFMPSFIAGLGAAVIGVSVVKSIFGRHTG